MKRIAALGLVMCAAGCVAPGDGRYAGTMVMTQGVCGPGYEAGQPAQATLVLQDGKAEFVPNDGVAVLTGTIDGAGHVHVANTAPGADHKPFVQVFEGMRTGDSISGDYASPRCRAKVTVTLK